MMSILMGNKKETIVSELEEYLLKRKNQEFHKDDNIPSYSEMNRVEKRVLKEAKKRKLCYFDLLNAMKSTEYRYREVPEKEKYYHDELLGTKVPSF